MDITPHSVLIGDVEVSSRFVELESAPDYQEKKTSFAFSQRHGLMISEQGPLGATVLHKADASLQALTEIRRLLGVAVRYQEIPDTDFDRLLTTTYEDSGDGSMAMMEGVNSDLDLKSVIQDLSEPEDLLDNDDDAPIIRLINALLAEAIKEEASDVHIEPLENRLVVRFRVDGVLRKVLEPQRSLTSLITSRIKVMAKLDIAEKRLPQDGRISLKLAGRAVDVRVSTIPNAHGERVVLRLLDKQAGRLFLDNIGMSPVALRAYKECINRPHGIVLVTGPTGSGKTTSLYASLTELNTTSRNIMTVEDPIEYYLDGVGQTQVNTKVEMTFSRGLRAILRQDPDIVMVGEIRDLETAQIAIQASLTGHLVFSTLHTNTAVGAVTRMRDMGVEPFLLSSSLLAVVAQRLVRTLCPHCKQPRKATASECKQLGMAAESRPMIYAPKGCPLCKESGYIGRMGIYELMLVDDPLRKQIHDGVDEREMQRGMRTKMPGIRQDGVTRVLNGDTSIEEVVRVTQED
ncbi:MAG: type II secretion system ATPase GspE [Sedimenticola sp.]